MAETFSTIAAHLAIPGLPNWVGLILLLVLGMALLAFLAMPFSVFGVKARLEQIEAQLDEIQTELRALVLRQGEGSPRRSAVVEQDWVEPPTHRPLMADQPLRARPNVPPAATWQEDRGSSRMEPRFDRTR